MNIYGPEVERIHALQRELQEAEQFRALVREMRQMQRRCRAAIRNVKNAMSPRHKDDARRVATDLQELRARLEAAVDAELRLLASE